MLGSRLSEDRAIESKDSRRRLYAGNLWLLATEILGYDKLSLTFHKPMLEEWDREDRKRFKGKHADSLELWPRDHIKTWCQRARVIRYYLIDPTITVTWWHSVEEMAQESGAAIGITLQKNKELRALFPPGVLPSPQKVKFVAGGGFRLNSNRIGDAPSMRTWGAGSEATGGHSRVGVLDDINALNDVVDSQFPAKKRWYQNTVCNVIRVSEGWKDAVGTRWDREDTWSDFLKSGYWRSRVRACLETDGKPDYKGSPVYLSQSEIDKKRAEMGELAFAFQMMNDPSPAGEKPWSEACEHYIPLQEAKGAGMLYCLSDPAPARVGSLDDRSAKYRGDGTKDDWAIAIVKLRARGQRREIVLLDGDFSKDWDLDEGYIRCFELMRKWGCRRLVDETVGQAVAAFDKRKRELARQEGVKYTPIDLQGTYRGGGKNAYFATLCSRARSDEFLISESCPARFLDAFLSQSRNWLPLPGGRNSLRYDDIANVVSFATDPALGYGAEEPTLIELTPFTRMEQKPQHEGSRYVQW